VLSRRLPTDADLRALLVERLRSLEARAASWQLAAAEGAEGRALSQLDALRGDARDVAVLASVPLSWEQRAHYVNTGRFISRERVRLMLGCGDTASFRLPLQGAAGPRSEAEAVGDVAAAQPPTQPGRLRSASRTARPRGGQL